MSNSHNAKKKRGFARIEFLAVQPDAKKLLDAGHTFQSAYDELFDCGKITMSYPMFAKYARNGVTPVLDQHPTTMKQKEKNAVEATPFSTRPPSSKNSLGVVEKVNFKDTLTTSTDEEIFFGASSKEKE